MCTPPPELSVFWGGGARWCAVSGATHGAPAITSAAVVGPAPLTLGPTQPPLTLGLTLHPLTLDPTCRRVHGCRPSTCGSPSTSPGPPASSAPSTSAAGGPPPPAPGPLPACPSTPPPWASPSPDSPTSTRVSAGAVCGFLGVCVHACRCRCRGVWVGGGGCTRWWHASSTLGLTVTASTNVHQSERALAPGWVVVQGGGGGVVHLLACQLGAQSEGLVGLGLHLVWVCVWFRFGGAPGGSLGRRGFRCPLADEE